MSDQAANATANDSRSRRDLANAIRALSMDAVQAANSGHPGAPMGMADITEVLWRNHLKHNPKNPQWFNRDRFVLSNGHGSMLLYATLHLSGYELSLEEIKQFRQFGSETPGHPEYGDTAGVETTTGPLGQGLANGVGMALAEKNLAREFNTDSHPIIDHYTYVFAGDGCLMEGISHEACSLAGTLGLGKLIVIYDDNGISIDGPVEAWFSDDTGKRFEAYGWQVISDVDGHDPAQIDAAITAAKTNSDKPTIICCKTVIGYGSPNKQGTAGSHGAALGEDEIVATREKLGWPYEPFEIPDDIYDLWDARESGQQAEDAWNEVVNSYKAADPARAAELQRRIAGRLPETWSQAVAKYINQTQQDAPKVATRKASEMALDAIGPVLPELIGGSADLTGSNNTFWSGSVALTADSGGNYINYGVREFAMTAMMNGIYLHGAYLPYGGTFLVFSDYARNAVRMSALMGLRAIHVYTHDSIGLGEDGPTHQPIEHAASLRLIPNLAVWRPADAVETAIAWQAAIERTEGPSCLLLTRQGLPTQARDENTLAAISRGGYILVEPSAKPDAIIIATGSEVEIAVNTATALNTAGKAIRVVSMPCVEQFEQQDEDYRRQVLPAEVSKRIAIEAGNRDYWYKFVGLDGCVIGLDGFGASAPAGELFKHFGLDEDSVSKKIKHYLEN
ncbi:MAG: transketolase [Gammaproteobacteria bacterium]